MQKKAVVVGLALFLLISIHTLAFAAFSLSVTPYEGGYDLRYGKISPASGRINKELTVSITSDIAKQYRLTQTLLEPLTNAQGVSIPPQSTFFVYAIRGSNNFGTLSVEQEVPVTFGRTIIYTSNTAGLADSFNLVYGLKGPLNVPSGSYRGRIGFTLEAIDSTQAPVTVTLNILAEIESEAAIRIETVTGARIISLNSEKEETRSAVVSVSIEGGLGRQFRILQLIAEPLKSEAGEELAEENISLNTKNETIPLSLRPQVIYTSGLQGEADNFSLTYVLANTETLKTGRYKTKLKYLLDLQGEQRLLATFDLEVEIERIFELDIKLESGTKIDFRDLKIGGESKAYEVIIAVKTNTGKPYQVTQKMPLALMNKEGNILSEEYFTLRTEGSDLKGALKFLEKTAVKKGDTILFISDKEGSPDTFKVIYELNTPPEVKMGDYSATIAYSLLEI